MKILSFRGEDGLTCGKQGGDLCQACPAHSAVIPDRGRAAWRVGVGWDLQQKNWQRYKPTEKNNKPHEERRNQEQHGTATPSFNALGPQLTLIFYHLAGGRGIHNNPTAFACLLSLQL